MNIDQFWQLIDKTRIESGNNSTQQARLLEDVLAQMPVEEIQDYDNILHQLLDRAYRLNLWDVANIIYGGTGDDGFSDFRAWLIGQGYQLYRDALQDPEVLADYVSLENRRGITAEELLYVAAIAYEKKTGDDNGLPFSHRQIDLRMEALGADENCWYIGDVELEKQCLQKLYAKTWAKFGSVF